MGPEDYEIIHTPGDDAIDGTRGGLLDPIVFGSVEAYFHNPYPASVGSWSHGFQLRGLGETPATHYVCIDEMGTLTHWSRSLPDGEAQSHTSTRIQELKIGEGEGNHISLDLTRRTITINKTVSYQMELGLFAAFVRPVASLFESDGVEGYSTHVDSFTIWN